MALHSLRALKYRAYRLFLLAQGMALIGTWCQRVAIAWLVYRTTGSALMLGVVAFAGEICFLLIAPFGGLIADRVQRGSAMMSVQAVSALQAFTLAILVWGDRAGFGWIVGLTLILGACQAIEMPLRQSMFSDFVTDPRDLPNAIALMAFMNNAGRVIGPIVAGFLIGVTGENVCFAVNGVGYLLVILALWKIRLPATVVDSSGGAIWPEIRAGFLYAWQAWPIRVTLGLLVVVSFCYLPYLVILPVFTKDVLLANASTLGQLLSGAGLGAVGGLFWIAASASAKTVPRMLAVSGCVGGIGMLVLSVSSSFVPALLATAAVGFGVVVTATASNVYLQAIAAPDKRGRVLGLFTMCFLGIAPFGNLVAGSLMERVGSGQALFTLGVLGLVGAGVFQWQRSRIRVDV